MKFELIISFLALLFSCSSGNKNAIADEIPEIPNIFLSANTPNIKISNDTLFYNEKLFSGYVFEIEKNGLDTIGKNSYYKGLLSGMQQKWYDKNVLMEQRYYLRGAKNGRQTAYWENGKKKFEFNAKNDAYEGELKEWNQNGNLIHLATFKDGQEDGMQKMWYDNGKIRANYVIKKGKRYGLLGTKNCVNVSDSIFIVK